MSELTENGPVFGGKSPEAVWQGFALIEGKQPQASYLKTIPADFVREQYESFASHKNPLVRKYAAQCSLESAETFETALECVYKLMTRTRSAVIALANVDSVLLLLASPQGKKFVKSLPYLLRSSIVTALLNVSVTFRLAAPKKLSVLLSDTGLIAACLLDSRLSDNAGILMVQNIPSKLKAATNRTILGRYLDGDVHLQNLACHVIEASNPEEQEQVLSQCLKSIADSRSNLSSEERLSFLLTTKEHIRLQTNGIQQNFLSAAAAVFLGASEMLIKTQCLTFASHLINESLTSECQDASSFEAMARLLRESDPERLLNRFEGSSSSDSGVDLALAAASLQEVFARLPFEKLIEHQRSVFSGVKRVAQANPTVVLKAIELLAPGSPREALIHSFFQYLRDSTESEGGQNGLAEFAGELLRRASSQTQLGIFEWLLDSGKDEDDFWRRVLDRAGFSKSWQSLTVEIARDGEETVRRLKKDLVTDGFRQGRETTTTFFLEKAKLIVRAINELDSAIPAQDPAAQLVVNVRSDLSSFLDQVNIRAVGAPGDRVPFDPLRHQDIDGTLEVGEIAVLTGCGYVALKDVSGTDTELLLKAPIKKLPS